jgi:hypothetical protein
MDSKGDENADKCSWTFSSTYQATNWAGANVNFGSKDYLTQQNWQGVGYQKCGISFP